MKATRGFFIAAVLSVAALAAAQAGPDEPRSTSSEVVVKTRHHYKVMNLAYLSAPVEYTGHYKLVVFPWEAVQYYPRYYPTGNPWSH